MDAPRTVPAVSSADLEEFYTNGTQAHPADHSQHIQPQPILVDEPGNRGVRIFEADLPRTAAPAAAPDQVKAQLRDELLSQLIFAARDLAWQGFEATPLNVGDGRREFLFTCRECDYSVYGTDVLKHKKGCRVARVLDLLHELMVNVEPVEPTSIGKETATEGRAAEPAADGKAAADSIGDFGEPWQYYVDDILRVTHVYDREGTLIATLGKADREAAEWAARIVASVNSFAGCADPAAVCE